MAVGTPGDSLLLNPQTIDLMLDANNDIALASGSYALAQDAGSAVKLFLGEYYYNTTLGTPYLNTTLGQFPPLQLVKSQAVTAAETVPGVASAQCFISSVNKRQVVGQVQITTTSGITAAVGFVR